MNLVFLDLNMMKHIKVDFNLSSLDVMVAQEYPNE